jgi:hypothetical protein
MVDYRETMHMSRRPAPQGHRSRAACAADAGHGEFYRTDGKGGMSLLHVYDGGSTVPGQMRRRPWCGPEAGMQL